MNHCEYLNSRVLFCGNLGCLKSVTIFVEISTEREYLRHRSSYSAVSSSRSRRAARSSTLLQSSAYRHSKSRCCSNLDQAPDNPGARSRLSRVRLPGLPSKVETIKVHHLIPGRYKVMDKLLLRV